MNATDTGKGEAAKLDDLTMWQVATLALFDLGGARQRLDSEDIAVRCHRLSPGRFGWKKLRHLPNLGAASEALSDARRERNGALIAGSPAENWILTPSGVDWARRYEHLLDSGARLHATRLTSREQREMEELRSHPVFNHWQEGGDFPGGNRLASAILISASSPVTAIERRLDQLASLAQVSEDAELKEYVAWLTAAFSASR